MREMQLVVNRDMSEESITCYMQVRAMANSVTHCLHAPSLNASNKKVSHIFHCFRSFSESTNAHIENMLVIFGFVCIRVL